jgi:hypothetical protein
MTTFLLSRISVISLLKHFQTICGPMFRAFLNVFKQSVGGLCLGRLNAMILAYYTSILCMFRRLKAVHKVFILTRILYLCMIFLLVLNDVLFMVFVFLVRR